MQSWPPARRVGEHIKLPGERTAHFLVVSSDSIGGIAAGCLCDESEESRPCSGMFIPSVVSLQGQTR